MKRLGVSRLAGRAIFPSLGIIVLCLAVCGLPVRVQPQGKPARKPSAPGLQSKQDPLAPLLRQATEAIDKSDFASALDPLQKYIAERPDDAYAHFQLGFAYAGLKRSEESKSEFSKAIALDPKMAAAHLNLGLVLMDSDPAAAAESFGHAADLQPKESRPRFLEGFCLERAGKLPEAIAEYQTALGLSPQDYEIQFALGRALLRTKDAAGAETQFRGAVAARGDSAPARLGLATALFDQNKYEDAAGAFADYLKLKPEDRAAHFNRAAALFDLNRYDDALAELDLADAGAAPSPDSLKMRGEIYVHQQKWKEAGVALTEAVKASPQDLEAATWLGHVDIELQDYPAAIEILDQVYHRNPQSADALRDLARAFFRHEDYGAALGAMDRLDKLETPPPATWFIRAICYDKLLRKAEAIDAYQKFLDGDNGRNDTQDFQARHRILVLQKELAQSPGKKKR
ncbi:MAG: tetratricopeptide repeat protein [Candidatus Acidiferrales bacterium]